MNPSAGAVLASVSDGDAADGTRTLDDAVAAQVDWRANRFHTAHRLLVCRADEFANIMTLESGKPRAEPVGEFALSMSFIQWYAERIAHIHGTYPTSSSGGSCLMTTKQSVGPALLINPWIFPMLRNARKGGAALAAGCTVVLQKCGGKTADSCTVCRDARTRRREYGSRRSGSDQLRVRERRPGVRVSKPHHPAPQYCCGVHREVRRRRTGAAGGRGVR